MRDQGYSCPYRKRNPLRFNVSDYSSCAITAYRNIPAVKCVILCPVSSVSSSQLNQSTKHCRAVHHRDVSSTSPVTEEEADPESGFGKDVDRRLLSKKVHDRIVDWVTLWQVLFGADGYIQNPGKSARTVTFILPTDTTIQRLSLFMSITQSQAILTKNSVVGWMMSLKYRRASPSRQVASNDVPDHPSDG